MTPAKHHLQAEMLLNRVRKNQRRLRSWASAEGVTCYRLYDRDIPEVPLAVDWYEGRLHIARYRRGADDEESPEWMAAMVDRLSTGLEVAREDIYTKLRKQGRGGAQYQPLASTGERFAVTENGLVFLVNLSDYLDTGLFLDHRITRRRVREEARGKRFLNLFAYTGAFSVYAAAGGALTTTTVDLSATYLDWAGQNMRANGFSTENHRYIRNDILDALATGRVQGTYDLVVLDAPTLSRSKAMAGELDIQRDHVLLLNRLHRNLSPGGIVYFSNNLKRFKLYENELEYRTTVDVTKETIPPDFRNRSVHHCFRLVK
jgi:23S rRNA (guanine2445-N2)-methyltransferase / 23S rRNA (guanine2069-N7)-methyltransferase